MFVALQASAQTTRIVNAYPNRPNSPNTYQTLQSAIDAANVGDALIIIPHPSQYNGTLGKRLVFIGVGLDVRKNIPSLRSIISISVISSNADQSEFKGLELSIDGGGFAGQTNPRMNVRYCIISSATSNQYQNLFRAPRYSIINSISDGVNVYDSIVQNSIFTSTVLKEKSFFKNNIESTPKSPSRQHPFYFTQVLKT